MSIINPTFSLDGYFFSTSPDVYRIETKKLRPKYVKKPFSGGSVRDNNPNRTITGYFLGFQAIPLNMYLKLREIYNTDGVMTLTDDQGGSYTVIFQADGFQIQERLDGDGSIYFSGIISFEDY